MKIVVIGGTGLIGKKLVNILRGQGHEAVPASPSTGVDTMTGEGLAAALAGADVVVHSTNPPDWSEAALMAFFTTSTRNIVAAATAAGARRHVVLSVVGADSVRESPYLRAKVVQESLVAASGTPYTIVRATQFFDFVPAIAQSSTVDAQVRLAPVWMQPVDPDEVAQALADAALGEAVDGIVDVAGPDRVRMTDLVRQYIARIGDGREVVADAAAPYFGATLQETSLVPLARARLGKRGVADWLDGLGK